MRGVFLDKLATLSAAAVEGRSRTVHDPVQFHLADKKKEEKRSQVLLEDSWAAGRVGGSAGRRVGGQVFVVFVVEDDSSEGAGVVRRCNLMMLAHELFLLLQGQHDQRRPTTTNDGQRPAASRSRCVNLSTESFPRPPYLLLLLLRQGSKQAVRWAVWMLQQVRVRGMDGLDDGWAHGMGWDGAPELGPGVSVCTIQVSLSAGTAKIRSTCATCTDRLYIIKAGRVVRESLASAQAPRCLMPSTEPEAVVDLI